MAITLNQTLGLTPCKRYRRSRCQPIVFHNVRITRSNIIGEPKAAIVEPLDLHVINGTGPARQKTAVCPQQPSVFKAAAVSHGQGSPRRTAISLLDRLAIARCELR